jgi:hypothetical protein
VHGTYAKTANQRLSYCRWCWLLPKCQNAAFWHSESPQTQHTNCNALPAPHRPVLLPGSSLALCRKSPTARRNQDGPTTPPKRRSAAGTALAVAACAASSIKSPPRDPGDPPYHSWRSLVHTNHTRCAESRNGCIQRVFGPPSDPEIRHVALAAVPAANLGPGTRPEPAPTTTGGTDGIRPAAGSPTPPRGCRRDHAYAGGGGARRVEGERRIERGGAACTSSSHANSRIPRLSPRPLSGSCKSRRKPPSSLFKALASSFSSLGHSQAKPVSKPYQCKIRTLSP